MIKTKEITKYPLIVKWFALTEILFLLLLLSIPFSLGGKDVWLPFLRLIVIFIGLPVSIYMLLLYRSISFIVEDGRITINSGIITKKSKVIPFNKIQNVNCVRGLLIRIFGLSVVNIWTASPSQININAKKPDGVLILTVDDAEWLKNFIINNPSAQ